MSKFDDRWDIEILIKGFFLVILTIVGFVMLFKYAGIIK